MSLADSIKASLPKNKEYTVFHWQSKPRDTHPLVTKQRATTVKVEHFISLAHNEKVFYALEIFVYITLFENHTEQLLFVSKADTNGQNESKVSIQMVTRSIIEHLLRIPVLNYLHDIIPKSASSVRYVKDAINRLTPTKEALRILLQRHLGQLSTPEQIKPYTITQYQPKIVTKIALFTRSEPQYLFPSSSDNPSKHILDGEGLLKWWLRTLDPIVSTQFDECGAYLRIPAEDDKIIRRYLSQMTSNWSIGDMFGGVDDDVAVFKVPLFPDDPKTRFLEHLCVESRIKKVTVRQFWEELQIRQEFRLGAVVSVIGIEGSLTPGKGKEGGLICSHKQLKRLKNFITGEDFHDEEGALESYRNIVNYLELNQTLEYLKGLTTKGQYVKPPVAMPARTTPTVGVNVLTTLVRKKQKK
jgi:regulator of Ty1 transposition protein 109